MTDEPELHRTLQADAVALDGDAHRALMAGDGAAASEAFARAARTYADSWEAAPPGAYGRLVGRVKAAVLSGDETLAREHAAAVLTATDADPAAAGSPAASWAVALAALVVGEEDRLPVACEAMRAGSPPFGRAADAVAALAAREHEAFTTAQAAIVEDFAGRDSHLTGVAIADTALVLDRLAAARGLGGLPASPVLPAALGRTDACT